MKPRQIHSLSQGMSISNRNIDEEVICFEDHGSEPAKVRFHESDNSPPTIATWRNNLTALSQHRNLYFVACAQEVHVYQPAGYGQTIGSTPALILKPQMKNPSAPGYISVNVPHAINSILVDDLGQEEILLLATDSGNVAAYRTEHIFAAIEENEESSDHLRPEAVGSKLDCFFLDWVGQSAWGLAIHKFARLIAVSSNTSYLTVFAFALADKSGDTGSDEETPASRLRHDRDSEWLSISSPSEYAKLRSWSRHRRRSRNLKLTLTGHMTNIPNLSFLNSDLDSDGNWLFSTDIDNKMLAWRIWDRRKPVHSWDFRPTNINHRDFRHDHQRGWNVLAIDPRVCRLKDSVSDACGGPPARESCSGSAIDLSFLGPHIPDANRYYDFFPPIELSKSNGYHFSLGGPASDESFSGSWDGSLLESREGADTLNTEPQLHESEEHMVTRRQGEAEPKGDATHGTCAMSPMPEAGGPSDEASTGQTNNATSTDNLASRVSTLLPPNHPIWEILRAEEEAEDDEEGENELHNLDSVDGSLTAMYEDSEDAQEQVGDLNEIFEDSASEESETESTGHDDTSEGQPTIQLFLQGPSGDMNSSFAESTDEETGLPEIFSEFPILHFSESHVRLIPNPYSEDPSVHFRSPLYQFISEPMPLIEACDRFNMIQHIPELGVVVAASQKGRVAIITLTRVHGEGVFFRVDRIAPFDNQERYGLRPLCPLLGIAAGPVGSHLKPLETSNDSSPWDCGVEAWRGFEYSRRYRLLLMYADHTVLHYELYYDWPRGARAGEGTLMCDDV